MAIHSHKLALAAAGSMAIWYTFCILTCWFWPQQSLQLLAHLIHASSLEHLAPLMSFTFVGVVCGYIQSMTYVYLFVWPMASIYNWLMSR